MAEMDSKDQANFVYSVVRVCKSLGLPFEVRHAIYASMIEAIKPSLDSAVKAFPRDEAWTAACLTEELARRLGVRNAEDGVPWMWTCWQLRTLDHPLGLAYESGYASVPRNTILGKSLVRVGEFVGFPQRFSPRDLAMILRVFSWQEEPLPKVFDQAVRDRLRDGPQQNDVWMPYPTIEHLLQAEASGLLYPERA